MFGEFMEMLEEKIKAKKRKEKKKIFHESIAGYQTQLKFK